jgi:DNA-binding transcriptional MerR regulator
MDGCKSDPFPEHQGSEDAGFMNHEDERGGLYRSGVAARLAGVPVGTLRIWERRYSVVGPRVSAGRQRLYSTAEIRRLTLIKQLVDVGHPIGTIASLGSDVLTGMQAATWPLQNARPGRASSDDSTAVRLALVGPLLVAEQFVKALSGGALRVTGRCADPAKAVVALEQVDADIALVELSTMDEADILRVASIICHLYDAANQCTGSNRAKSLAHVLGTRHERGLGLAGHQASAVLESLERVPQVGQALGPIGLAASSQFPFLVRTSKFFLLQLAESLARRVVLRQLNVLALTGLRVDTKADKTWLAPCIARRLLSSIAHQLKIAATAQIKSVFLLRPHGATIRQQNANIIISAT